MRKNLTRLLCSFLLLATMLPACSKFDIMGRQTRFDAKSVQKWYDEVFKNSPEWAASRDITEGEEQPVWAAGAYKKVGDVEYMTFPLLKQKPKVVIVKTEGQAEEEIKQIANAAITNIVFSKDANGTIAVKEAQYVPEIDYLKSRNQGIGDDIHNGFTGNIMLKYRTRELSEEGESLNGKVLMYNKNIAVPEGQSTQARRIAPGGKGGCGPKEVCVYQQDCTDWFSYAGNQYSYRGTTCGAWSNTGQCYATGAICPGRDPVYGHGGGGGTNTSSKDPVKDCLTLENLKKIFPNTPDAQLQKIIDNIKEYAKDFNINSKAKLNHLIAQMGHETQNFTRFEENQQFRVKRLNVTWGNLFNPTSNPTADPKKANPYDFREPGGDSTWASQEKLLNYVYGYSGNVLGNNQPGDGYKYRGRGGMHLTGKYNYGQFTKFYNGYSKGNASNFVNDPGLVGSNMQAAIISGLWYFNERINKKMSVNDNTSVEAVTKKVNANLDGIDSRKKIYKNAKTAMKDC